MIRNHALKTRREPRHRGGGGLAASRANSVLSSPPRIIFSHIAPLTASPTNWFLRRVVLGGFEVVPRLAELFVLCLRFRIMSVEGDTDILIYFEAWYDVPGGNGFDKGGEYIDLRAIDGMFFGSTRGGSDHISA